MSCLYSSPEVASLGLSLSWSFVGRGLVMPSSRNIVVSSCRFARFGTRYTHQIAAQLNSTQILPYVAVSKDAFPSSPAYAARCTDSFSLPKQAQVSRVIFQAQYQAFVRFAVRSSAAL